MHTPCRATGSARPILHVGAHAAQGPDGQLVRLSPVLFCLLQLLSELPPHHVARYDDVARALWPDGAEPYNVSAQVRWHARNLDHVLQLVGYAPRSVRVVDRVGLEFCPRAADHIENTSKPHHFTKI